MWTKCGLKLRMIFMETKRIEDYETWLVLKQMIAEKGYKRWQAQYGWDQPEGLIVGFMCDDKRLEIATHNREIAEDMLHSHL